MRTGILRILAFVGGLAASAGVAGSAASIAFTLEEQSYIAQAGVIHMCVDPDWVPFERINEEGRHEGIAADLVQLVAQRVGLRIELLRVANWEESLAASKSKRCQIMSFLNQTPVRDQWLIFTQPVFSDQNVIITREEHPYIGDPKSLTGKTIVLPRGTMVEERVRRDFPGIKVVTTPSEAEAMSFVSERKADLTVRSLIVAAYEIKKKGLFNLKISGQIPAYANQLRIGVVRDQPVLRDILDKGVATITPQEREAIVNKHVAINVQKGIDYTLVWAIVFGGGLILLLVLYWNRRLKALNKELTRLAVTDPLTGLFNRLKTDEVLDQEFERTLRFGHVFSVVLLDIDRFKQVNDAHGHQAGDAVLVGIADQLRRHTRKTDIVGRWGGEEFIVICPHTALDGARQLGEYLRGKIQAYSFPAIQAVTASFGVATYQSGDQPKDIVARADAALYEAKRLGRNRVVVR